MEKFVCVHGHFYQPPRENAWLEYVEIQDSAYPYHDWNERISDECYAPNTASRILDKDGFISSIVNNYCKISHDFGPTLLSWMKEKDPETYAEILAADKASIKSFSGHGSAMAQAYNHMIMPLANSRDKYTQVFWGLKDFEHRFGRKPEGMWMPETAVDLETLAIMAAMGIKFVILAPHQAKRVRDTGQEKWTDVPDAGIDTRMPYRLLLPSGRSIAVFFYDGPLSQAIAFEDVLTSGENFANRLLAIFNGDGNSHDGQLAHIATDGETYGHHHRFGDMALAYAIDYLERNGLARITNYAEYLEKFPPQMEVEIIENTSWSCSHGVERWRSNCGCNAGRNPKWNQEWRAPLREALDWLRDNLAGKYEHTAAGFLKYPWAARNDYISIILDRSPENIYSFMERHRSRELNDADIITVLKLLELQRHAMLMYTSCGWYFDELSGIETVQIIQYAGRAVQLSKEVMGNDVEERFLEMLAKARSNLSSQGDGRRIFERYVRPAIIDLTRVTAHFAVSSIFEEYGEEAAVFCYRMGVKDFQSASAGEARMATGKVRATSVVTGETALLSFGVLHFGGHNINAGVREFRSEEEYGLMQNEINRAFSIADFPEVIRLLDRHFGISTYSIKDLFLDEQRKVLDNILESALSDIESAYANVYRHHYPPMRFLTELGYSIPKSFHTAAEFILNGGLRKAFASETMDLDNIRNLLDEARTWNVELDDVGLSYLLQQNLEEMMEELSVAPDDTGRLENMLGATETLQMVPFQVDLWKVQNLFQKILTIAYPAFEEKAGKGDKPAAEWLAAFSGLGRKLSMRVD